MNKSQVIIVASIVGVVLLIIIYGIARFGGRGKDVTYIQDFEKPLVTKDYKAEYKSRIDRIKKSQHVQEEKEIKTAEFEVYSSNGDTLEIQEPASNTILEKSKEINQKVKSYPKQTTSSTKKSNITTSKKIETVEINKEEIKEEEKQEEEYDLFSTVLNYPNSNSSESLGQNISSTNRHKAEIYGYHELTNNSAVQIRVLEEFFYKGIKIHYNARLFGIAQYNGGRFLIHIDRVKTSKGEFLADMIVFDHDGIEGIYYKDDIGKKLENDKDNLVSRIGRKSGTYEGELFSEVAEKLNESVLNEKLKPLKLRDYGIFIKPIN